MGGNMVVSPGEPTILASVGQFPLLREFRERSPRPSNAEHTAELLALAARAAWVRGDAAALTRAGRRLCRLAGAGALARDVLALGDLAASRLGPPPAGMTLPWASDPALSLPPRLVPELLGDDFATYRSCAALLERLYSSDPEAAPPDGWSVQDSRRVLGRALPATLGQLTSSAVALGRWSTATDHGAEGLRAGHRDRHLGARPAGPEPRPPGAGAGPAGAAGLLQWLDPGAAAGHRRPGRGGGPGRRGRWRRPSTAAPCSPAVTRRRSASRPRWTPAAVQHARSRTPAPGSTTARGCGGSGAGVRPPPACGRLWRPSSGWAPRPGPSGRGWSCWPAVLPCRGQRVIGRGRMTVVPAPIGGVAFGRRRGDAAELQGAGQCPTRRHSSLYVRLGGAPIGYPLRGEERGSGGGGGTVATDDAEELLVFSGSASPKLTQQICGHLGIPVGQGEVLRFSEGTLFPRVLENVRGHRVYLVQSTVFPANDHFMELLFWIDAFKRASASSVTVVIPYFSYAKGDKKDEPRVSIRARVCADAIEAAGADRVVTMDLHAAQIQGFFRIPVDDLYARAFLCDAIRAEGLADPVVVSPDAGFAKKARVFARRLGAPLAIADKVRSDHRERPTVVDVIGEVGGSDAVLVDDLTISAGTLVEASEQLMAKGARSVMAAVSHGVFAEGSMRRLDASPIRLLITTDTVETQPVRLSPKVRVVSAAPLFAEAIRRIHHRESISGLFND